MERTLDLDINPLSETNNQKRKENEMNISDGRKGREEEVNKANP
jgi:hypothetical protein